MSGSVKELREDVQSVKAESGLSDRETRQYLADRLKEYESSLEAAKKGLANLEQEYKDSVTPIKLQVVQLEVVIEAVRNALWNMSQSSRTT